MKKPSSLKERRRICLLLLPLWFVLASGTGYANPLGMTVISGSANSTQHGNVLQISTSQNASLQWSSFNIAAGQTTIFNQPSATSIVVNNIKSANPSTIFGSLQANGYVILENQSGFYFGPHAFVKAGGLVVTTAAIDPWSSAGGAGWSFDGPPAKTPIINYGQLETASGGSLFLIAKRIENNGVIEAPGGTAALVAGQQVLLSERPDGLSLSAPVTLPVGSVNNQGKIVADAGQVLLQAQTVNNSGIIQANAVREQNGVIELYASQDIQLTGSSVIQANGDGQGVSQGGNIAIKSGGVFSDSAGSQITATGGANGGNGGNVEISALNILSLKSSIDAGAQPGWSEGQFTLDPMNIVLGTSFSGTPPTGTVDMNVNTGFQNVNGSILLQATDNITLNSTWNLSASTGQKAGQLTLEAGGNITLNSSITDANNWSVTLDAGYNFATGQGVVSGVGNVTLSGGSAIQTAAGNINVLAGGNVALGTGGIVTGISSGAVMTGGGGNINVQAVAGNVNCGSSTLGYDFVPTGVGYAADPGLGGISTAAGGNDNIEAGGNIAAFLPNSKSAFSDSGSGAFGAAPGNVTVTAGGNVYGHFVVANGTGTITAGNAGLNSSQSLALSLIKGGWVVNASDNIFLQEVRNPNGMFNHTSVGGTPAPTDYLYNYDPLASVTLNAGNGVTISGASVPRESGSSQPLIFPPTLTIDAGAGGITLEQNINLFPSPEGTLNLTTTGGGNLTCVSSSSSGGVTLNISDSQSDQWVGTTTFTSLDTHLNDLLHLNDPNPVLIAISGSVSDFYLISPKSVQMYVAGNVVDSTVAAENLHPTDDTIISAGGEILDHSSYVILALPAGETPDFTALNEVEDPFLNAITLQPVASSVGLVTIPNPNFVQALQNVTFGYDASINTLLFSGKMSAQAEGALLAMTTPFLPAAAIQQVYSQSLQEARAELGGYTVAGPGLFQVQAASIDLGNSAGIDSVGIDGYGALAPLTTRGADLDVSVSENISMLSSSIESEYGGALNITSGGTIDVGSALVGAPSIKRPLGIDSLWGGNINVVAEGDINVDGSRIAAYDGGNIFVESLTGSVNAGSGGGGAVLVSKPYLNQSGQAEDLIDNIPGSGILATSFPQLVYGQTSGQIGNITVETPEGNIDAAKGGISQLVLGPVAHNDATINLTAGSKNSDGSVAYVGNVNATGSGVIGGQVDISATGSINGLVVASIGADVNAVQNVSATVVSQGAATVSAGGTVSGTVVGVGSVSVSGASDVAAAFSASGVSTSGATSGAAVAAAPTGSSSSSAAATAQQVTQTTQANSDLTSNSNSDDNDLKKKKKKTPLMEYVGRVTVLLP